MFASKKLSLNEWKNWAIGLVGNTMSSIDQATSRWFWSLISDLPRDYFAKTFDQVNYLDKRVWEGMFRLRIDDIKKQLELGMSESVLETNLVKLQGLIGKYSLSPAVYEDGLKELENFTSNLPNSDDYLKTLVKVKNEFREELKSQPVLLKECIESEVNLERKEGAYYKSLLDDRSLKNTSPERVISESPILDKAAVSKRGNNNYKLRNISKLLFSNPGQALTLFLAAQSAFASAANIQMSNSTGLAIGNDTLSFDNNLSNLSEFEGRINENVSLHSISKSGNFRNSNKVRKEIEVVERDLDGGFTEIRDEFKDLRDTAELVEVLTYVKSQRSKRAANELDSEMETVAEDPLETIDGLDKRVKELEGEIQKLKNSTSSSVKGYKDQIASLEGQKMNLEQSFNDMKRQFNQTLSEKASKIKGLSVMVKKLREQVEDLNKKIQENERKYLYVECARDIEAGKFRDAEEKLRQINDDTKIAYIVDRVYKNNSEGRFSLLLEFGKSLRSIHLTFSVCKFLDHEMRVSNSSDVLEVIELANAVKSEVINQVNVSCGTKKEASDLLNNLKDRIKNMAVEVLSGAMQENKYNQDNTSVVTISNAVYLLESRLFLSTVKDVIDKVYGKVDIGEVLKSATINTYIKQDISGSIAIFEKMKKEGHLNSSASLRLAGCIRVIVMQPNYENVDSEARDNLERLKNELPSSISAIAFASEVCIKSAKYDEYLYAASDVLNYDSDRRTVFTWVPKNRVANGHWALSYYQDGSFAIKNIQHNEYLFASGFTYGKYSCTEDVEFTKVLRARTRVCLHDRYRVFTWTKGIEVNNGYWEFLHDPVNEGLVKIRNVFHNNYLFSSDVRYDRDRRMVLASDGVGHSRDLWKFEDCEDWRRRRDVKEVQDVRNSTEESLQENINPSTQISDITLERVKITDKNISFTGR